MKNIIISILMIALMACFVSAGTVVTLNSGGTLTNNSYQTSSTITHYFKVTGNQSAYSCYLYSNENGTYGVGSWQQKEWISNVANASNTSFSNRLNVADVYKTAYTWDVFCNATNDVDGDWGIDSNASNASGFTNYSVDTVSPTIGLIDTNGTNVSAISGRWFGGTYKNDTVLIMALVNDTNADTCLLFSTFNYTTGGVKTFSNANINATDSKSYANNTAFMFPRINNSVAWIENITGKYIWMIRCNDSAGYVTDSANQTIYVDSTVPTAFNFSTYYFKTDHGMILTNGSTSTDYTPQISWNNTYDTNFSRYEITFYRDAYGTFNSSEDVQLNVTCGSNICGNSSNSTTVTTPYNMSTLAGDKAYWINIVAYDLAGNSLNMSTIHYKYTTDSTNRALKAGWNIIGNVGNSIMLTTLLSYSGATTVSWWNQTHEFLSHVSGGANNDSSVPSGDAALLYLAADTNYNDMVWNVSAFVNDIRFNLTNRTTSNWSLTVVKNSSYVNTSVGTNFQKIDMSLNQVWNTSNLTASANWCSNVTYMSFYNNSAGTGAKYVPFVANWSINNASAFEFGNVIWMYYDAAGINQTLDWSRT